MKEAWKSRSIWLGNGKVRGKKYLIFPNVCLVERIEKWRVEKLFCLKNEGAIFSHYSNVARIKSFIVPFSFGYY